MPSDRPPPEPSRPGSDPAGRRRPTAAVRDGTLAFALVLGGFAAYAVGAPATYEATAIVAVSPIPGSSPALPGSAEAVQLLRRAALEPALVASLGKEERPAPSETAADVSSQIAKTLSIESSDGRSFTFRSTGSSPERAQRIVTALAQQAAKRAAYVLDPQPAPADPSARAKADLQEFLAAHPGIGAEPSAAPPRSAQDPLIQALRVEKSRIEEKLAQMARSSEENPYEQPALLDNPDLLKRRLKEIDTSLETRTKNATAPNPAGSSRATAEDLAEWQRLVQAASEKNPKPAPPATRLRVTLASAALPRLPIEPNRVHVVLLGILFATVGGVLAGLLRSAVEARALRRYGLVTDAHPIAPLPQTTLRIPRERLPKLIAPQAEPAAAPIPAAADSPIAVTPIPPAPGVPQPITPIPPVPIVPSPMTPIPAAPIAPSLITPIPPAPLVPARITGIPQAVLGPALVAPSTPEAITPSPAAVLGAAPITPVPPAPIIVAPVTPVPPSGVAPPHVRRDPPPPMVIQAPNPNDDAPPTTQGYEEPERPGRQGRNAARRVTKIYGTPPPPELEAEARALRTTQAFGSPPVAIPPHRPPEIPHSTTPFPAEVLPPEHRSSMRPAPMIPLAGSSAPPPGTPATRSGAPFAETGYSYVQTPMPPAPDSIPQTPHPRRPSPPPRAPSPPPRTYPYGSLPPAQPRPSQGPPGTPKTPVPPRGEPKTPHPPAGLPKTPLPPAPKPSAPTVVVRTHRVDPGWRPDAALRPDRRKVLAGEILTLAVERCLIVTVTGVRGMTNEKSTTAAEVAIALAEAKHPRVLLVESDFQYPQVHKWLNIGVPLAAGFSQQLRGRVDEAREGRWHVVECTPSLHVLAEGIMRSPGLLLSNRFEDGMRELRTYYDIIVIDAPAAPNEADGRAIADVVDGALVVGPPSRAAEIVEVSRIFSGKKLLRVVES